MRATWPDEPRVQATIFLPRRLALSVDDVRRRWDPTMVHRIAPHVTVLHRPRSYSAVADRLARLAPALTSFRLRVGGVRQWPYPDHGIYLAIDDPDGGLARLRNLLAATSDEPLGPFRPHVTLAHARTVHRATVRRAWTDLQRWRIDRTIKVGEIALIESTYLRWRTVATFALGTPPRAPLARHG